MDLKSEGEYISLIEPETPDEYSERLSNSVNAKSSGAAALFTYIRGRGIKNPLKAFRTGILVGLNTRIIDDIVDGEHLEPVSARDEFGKKYVESLRGKNPEPVEENHEEAAYRLARVQNEVFESSNVFYWQDIRDMLATEDKSTRESYKRHVRAAGGMVGELVCNSLKSIDDFDPNTQDYKFAYDLGRLGMISDDIMDEDADLPELKQMRMEYLERPQPVLLTYTLRCTILQKG